MKRSPFVRFSRVSYEGDRSNVSKLTGSVKWFNPQKGFGFLTRDDGQRDVFVHFSAIQSNDTFRNLNEGERVSFEVEDGPKGPRAKNVERI